MAILGILKVHLHGGKGMRNVDFLGKNDPYAVVSYKTQDQKSKTLEGGGSDPVWNQAFYFEVDDDDDEGANVTIKIFDEDKHSADDIIGEAVIPLDAVLSELDVPAKHYDLIRPSGHPRGHVEVSLKFVPKTEAGAEQQRPPQAHHNSLNSSDGPYGSNNGGGWK